MTFNGVMALILRYFTEFDSFQGALRKMVEDVVLKSSRSLSHLLMSFLYAQAAQANSAQPSLLVSTK